MQAGQAAQDAVQRRVCFSDRTAQRAVREIASRELSAPFWNSGGYSGIQKACSGCTAFPRADFRKRPGRLRRLKRCYARTAHSPHTKPRRCPALELGAFCCPERTRQAASFISSSFTPHADNVGKHRCPPLLLHSVGWPGCMERHAGMAALPAGHESAVLKRAERKRAYKVSLADSISRSRRKSAR